MGKLTDNIPLIGQGINAVGGLIQGHYNRKTARENTDKTILANKNMAEYAYSKDLEMWNKSNQYNYERWQEQNLYNSPSSQMQRYKEAGLNPNLIYGTGTSSAGNTSLPSTSQTAKYQSPRQEYNYQPNNFGAVLGQYQDTRMKSAQIDNIKEQTQTQTLENALRSGRIESQLTEAKNKARMSGDMADLRHLENMEKAWRAYSGITMQKALLELSQSQANVTRTQQQNTIGEWHKSLASEGMSPTDNLWMRQLHNKGGNIFQKIIEGIREATPGGFLPTLNFNK